MNIRRSSRTHLVSALCACLLAGTVHASDGELTWAFDVTTTGGDINWTSPTGVDPTASLFNTSYVITVAEVTVPPFGVIDLTGVVDPALLSEADIVVGPAPVTLAAESIVFPDPPDPPSLSADITFGIDALGRGFFSAENVFLGSYLGFSITQVHIEGTLTAHATWFDEGNGLAGTHGVPLLEGFGTAKPTELVTLTLSNALENSSSALVVGLFAINVPFKGGTMVPKPNLIFFGLPTDATGGSVFASPFPPGAPARFTLVFQHWVTDAVAPAGFSASNGLRVQTP
jgi:hypothetical protein